MAAMHQRSPARTPLPFLNDSSEITYGRQLFFQRLERLIESGIHQHGQRVLDQVNRTLKAFAGEDRPWEPKDHFYVSSFCTDGNLLSQWRAYGGSGASGCSIGFRVPDMVKRAEIVGDGGVSQGVTLHRVWYDPRKQETFIDDVIAQAFSALGTHEFRHTTEPNYLANDLFQRVIPVVVSCRSSRPCSRQNKSGVW
jgi:hypothetical protein